ncbi:MAG: peptidoglycan DD-metalloendopeptidase family protein [Betaproteobacteria bacterium]
MAERSRREADLVELREKVTALQRELAESGEEQADAADALRESERAISGAARTLSELAARQLPLQQQLAGRQVEVAALDKEQSAHRQALAQLLVAQHRNQQQDPLRILLLGQGLGDVSRQFVYLRALNGARRKSLTEARQRATLAAEARTDIELHLAELAQLAQTAREQAAILEQERTVRRRTLVRIGQQLDERRRRLATAQADETRLARLVARLAALLESRRHPPPPPAGGTPRVARSEAQPADGDIAKLLARFKGALKIPAVGELSTRFGVPRDGSGLAWKGWFIRTPAGTPVHAVATGKVVYADWLRGFGNLVIIDHGDGFMSLYGNNDALLQQVGAVIDAGQAVAQAGSSGGAAESGVYFELRHNGIAFDPKDWFGAH